LFQMLNPITHADTAQAMDVYKVEPYVVAADVYTAKGHLGRGGWTWYTGSASWMYRTGLEAILGFQQRGERLFIKPCIPESWNEFTIQYRYRSSTYEIRVENPDSVQCGPVDLTVDGRRVADAIDLIDDGQHHRVTASLGSSPSSAPSKQEKVRL
jgi:cyclic beta-1,2-glucan synthetase